MCETRPHSEHDSGDKRQWRPTCTTTTLDLSVWCPTATLYHDKAQVLRYCRCYQVHQSEALATARRVVVDDQGGHVRYKTKDDEEEDDDVGADEEGATRRVTTRISREGMVTYVRYKVECTRARHGCRVHNFSFLER